MKDGRPALKITCRRGPEVKQEDWDAACNRLFQTVKVYNATGQPVGYREASATGGDRNGYSVSYVLAGSDAAKVVWEFETGTAEYRIPFEFQDLPLS